MNSWWRFNEERPEEEYEDRWIKKKITLTCPKHEPGELACKRCKHPEKDHPTQYPCDVHGVKKTVNHKTKYVRIDKKELDKTVKLLLDIWMLPKPRFIISFVGGNNAKTGIPRGFCRGLTDLVEKLGRIYSLFKGTLCKIMFI
ncbi:hypothetical protein SNE40_010852 [Patella caerulea]|uniref:Uncharacterized protein n=1 Tax=Patella caerulea TaxID=87958 RepID=A0AAN8JUY6_PATCE